ncbi:actin-related protein 2/3 complex subunit 5-C-like [Antedon mediterranea]|uniref:actin-related protein 2/3 complex subunit 5-C-like n=1 Tax=Antedon mediterranea TaxID=105859 RepID=UPI003AF48DA7
MSKNTGSSMFRKVDVDEFDENKFQDDQVEGQDSSGPDESEIQRLLNKYPLFCMHKKLGLVIFSNALSRPICFNTKQSIEALQAVLKNPPLNTKNQAVKDKTFSLVVRVLSSFKTSDIDSGINALDDDSKDVLMKYIYRGFAEPSENTCGILLSWHEKVVAVGELGIIIRCLTDRKSV